MDASSDDDSSVGSTGYGIAPAPVEHAPNQGVSVAHANPLTIDTTQDSRLGIQGPLLDGNEDRLDEIDGEDVGEDGENDGEGDDGGVGCVDERGSTAARKRLWAGSANVVVAVRVRPLPKQEVRSVIKVVDARIVVALDPGKMRDEKEDVLRAHRSRERRYAFDHVFDASVSTAEVYTRTAQFMIQGVLDGFNATVFAYGQTGAGKTHTMIGSAAQPGIMHLTLKDLFAASQRSDTAFKVTASFLEVYNENIRDLLADTTTSLSTGAAAAANSKPKEALPGPGGRSSYGTNSDCTSSSSSSSSAAAAAANAATAPPEYLDLREDPLRGPTVVGITEVPVANAAAIMALLTKGNASRIQAPTAANETSSRSHAVLQVVVENREAAKQGGAQALAKIKVGKLSLVDLAGSERAAATKNRGQRQVEGANINRSLLALGNCINALGEKGNRAGAFVPYRDSKLTRLLKDSLGGNCRTVMIAAVSSSLSSFEETLNTLKYANRAKNIKTTVRRNVVSMNSSVGEYVSLIEGLRSEIDALKGRLKAQKESATSVVDESVTAAAGGGVQPSGVSLHHHHYRGIGGGLSGIDEHGSSSSDGLAGSAVAELEALKTDGSGDGSNGGGSRGKQDLAALKNWIQENFRERMQLRRSLIELEDQNVQNSIEISQRQVVVVKWNETRGRTPKHQQAPHNGGSGSGSNGGAMGALDWDGNGSVGGGGGDGVAAALLADAPEAVKQAWSECAALRAGIERNSTVKRSIAKRLRDNEKQAEDFQKREVGQCTGEDRQELLSLQYKIGKLELDNMQLEQAQFVHDSLMKGKALTIQKLQLQLAMKERVIERQRAVLAAHGLGHEVSGYAGMRLNEHAALGSNGGGDRGGLHASEEVRNRDDRSIDDTSSAAAQDNGAVSPSSRGVSFQQDEAPIAPPPREAPVLHHRQQQAHHPPTRSEQELHYGGQGNNSSGYCSQGGGDSSSYTSATGPHANAQRGSNAVPHASSLHTRYGAGPQGAAVLHQPVLSSALGHRELNGPKARAGQHMQHSSNVMSPYTAAQPPPDGPTRSIRFGGEVARAGRHIVSNNGPSSTSHHASGGGSGSGSYSEALAEASGVYGQQFRSGPAAPQQQPSSQQSQQQQQQQQHLRRNRDRRRAGNARGDNQRKQPPLQARPLLSLGPNAIPATASGGAASAAAPPPSWRSNHARAGSDVSDDDLSVGSHQTRQQAQQQQQQLQLRSGVDSSPSQFASAKAAEAAAAQVGRMRVRQSSGYVYDSAPSTGATAGDGINSHANGYNNGSSGAPARRRSGGGFARAGHLASRDEDSAEESFDDFDALDGKLRPEAPHQSAASQPPEPQQQPQPLPRHHLNDASPAHRRVLHVPKTFVSPYAVHPAEARSHQAQAADRLGSLRGRLANRGTHKPNNAAGTHAAHGPSNAQAIAAGASSDGVYPGGHAGFGATVMATTIGAES